MKETKRSSLVAPKILKRKKTRLMSSIVTYLKSDSYFFAPLFSNSPPFTTPQIQSHSPSNSDSSKADDISMAGFESLGIERVIKEYLKSDFYMYQPMISPPKLGSSLKGKFQITNLVTMEVSTSREDNNYRSLQSKVAEQTLHNGKIILEGQRTGTDLSPSFSSLPEDKMGKPDQRRVTIK
ncbi:hypothetical protein V5N11_004686 [Cardamine amara subsp. amara]|uniref:Uncharacterized protein n=1 Tax=Cardamine amara subsp. amara TaxID=228776 RepID=A0ABD1BK00_CARAN